MRTSVRIDGIEDAIRAFRRAPSVARKYLTEAVRVTEILLAQQVRGGIRDDTGALRQSIGSRSAGLRASITIEPGEIYGRRPEIYWRFVEFGSVHNVPARPFIRPAAEREQAPFLARITDAGARMERALDV